MDASILDEEVTEFLGRMKLERRKAADAVGLMSILDRVKKNDQAAAVELLREVCCAESRNEAEKEKRAFQVW